MPLDVVFSSMGRCDLFWQQIATLSHSFHALFFFRIPAAEIVFEIEKSVTIKPSTKIPAVLPVFLLDQQPVAEFIHPDTRRE